VKENPHVVFFYIPSPPPVFKERGKEKEKKEGGGAMPTESPKISRSGVW